MATLVSVPGNSLIQDTVYGYGGRCVGGVIGADGHLGERILGFGRASCGNEQQGGEQETFHKGG